MRIKQSICYPMLKPGEMNFDDFCKAGADMGYDAIEMWGFGDEFYVAARAAKKAGLAVSSTIGVTSLEHGLNNRENHERILAELKQSIDIAADLGVRGLIAFSGNRREGLTDAEGAKITAEGLSKIAPYAEKKKVYVNLELLNSKVDHIGYQCDRTAWAIGVVEQVACPHVRVLYDIYHMQIMEGDVIRTIRDNIRWIGHFHTAGNPGRGEFGDDQELNYRGICQAIAATDFDGYVGHEFRPGPAGAMEALRKAHEICNVG